MAPPHRSQPPQQRNIAPRQATECSLYFAPRGKTQPLYRPAALRRSSPAPAPHQQHPHVVSASNSPPASPSLSVVETKSSWLGSLPWSPVGSEREFRFDVQPTGSAAGTMLPKSQWRPDEEALICADADCTIRFGLIDRKHHCRRCGEIYCAAHSSRTSSLWPHPTEPLLTPPTPKATPKSTPRSSTVDIPSLAFVSNYTSPGSSAISIGGSSNSSSHNGSHTPTSSPPKNAAGFPPSAVVVRVCDSCYFAAPTPPLLTPPLPNILTRPLTLHHPRGSVSSSAGFSSFSQSPPRTQRQREKSRSRSRQGSASGASSFGTSASTSTTPPTSLDTNLGTRSRGVSPATSLRGTSGIARKGIVYEEPRELLDDEDEESDEEPTTEEENSPVEPADGEQQQKEGAPNRLLKRESAFGSVKGAWQSWATF